MKERINTINYNINFKNVEYSFRLDDQSNSIYGNYYNFTQSFIKSCHNFFKQGFLNTLSDMGKNNSTFKFFL